MTLKEATEEYADCALAIKQLFRERRQWHSSSHKELDELDEKIAKAETELFIASVRLRAVVLKEMEDE